MGDFNHSHSRWEGNLIIFAETSGMVEPEEGTFDHPSPREHFPLVRFDFFWNINVKAELTLHIRNKSATISSICTELLDRRIPPIPSFRSKYPTFCVMNIGSRPSVKSCGSGIRQSQVWSSENRVEWWLKPFLTHHPGGPGGMRAESVNAVRFAGIF